MQRKGMLQNAYAIVYNCIDSFPVCRLIRILTCTLHTIVIATYTDAVECAVAYFFFFVFFIVGTHLKILYIGAAIKNIIVSNVIVNHDFREMFRNE